MTTIRTVDVTLTDTTGMKRLVEIQNLATNPRAGTVVTGFGGGNGTGGAATTARSTTGGPLTDSPSFWRRTLTTAPTGGSLTLDSLDASINGVSDMIGQTVEFTAYTRATKTFTNGANLVIAAYNGATYLEQKVGNRATVASTVWTRLPKLSYTIPNNATHVLLRVAYDVTTAPALAVGDTFDISGLLLTKQVAGFDGNYFDGASSNAVWVGTPHLSRSRKLIIA